MSTRIGAVLELFIKTGPVSDVCTCDIHESDHACLWVGGVLILFPHIIYCLTGALNQVQYLHQTETVQITVVLTQKHNSQLKRISCRVTF